MPTTIQIFDEDWSRLNARKQQGDGFKDVVNRILDELEEYEAQDTDGDDAHEPEPDPAPEQRELQEPVDDLDDPDGALHGEGQPLNVAGDDVQEETTDVVEELLDDWNPGRTREERAERRRVGEAALQLLIDDGGPLMKADFVDELLPEYDVDEQSQDTWWRKSARPGLMRAVKADLAEHHHGPPHEYVWTAGER